MSNLPHPMVRRSERNPREEADGGKDSSNESGAQPQAEMESNLVSSDTTTESQDTDSSDELTEPVAAASSPSVSGSPGVRMGVSADAVPVPEVEQEAPEANTTYNFAKIKANIAKKATLSELITTICINVCMFLLVCHDGKINICTY